MSGRGTIVIYKTAPQATVIPIEIKGIGNPDAICDALAERISANYCRYCFENFGVIVPYTIDGLTMDEGVSKVAFGKGEMVRPIRLYVRGTFIAQFMNRKIPYMDIAKKTIYDYLDSILPQLKAREWVRIIDGTQSYGGPKRTLAINKLVANHMYVVTAHYPPTPEEANAQRIEDMLNSPAYKKSHPYIGPDNKIIYIQNGNSADIEAYVSMISAQVPTAEALKVYSETVQSDIKDCATKDRVVVRDISLYSSDDALNDPRVLTVTGSSVENSNGGAIGRSRYQVYHAARVYSKMAYRISERIYKEEKVSSSVTLISRIGWPMTMPWRSFIELHGEHGDVGVNSELWHRIEDITDAEFCKVEDIVKELMYGIT